MKMLSKVLLLALLAGGMSFFSASMGRAGAQTDDPKGSVELERTTFYVKQWRADGSHLIAVKGKLTYGGQPVANAVVRADYAKRNLQTGEDGSFELLVDRSLLAYTPVRVVSADQATIAGKPVDRKAADRLTTAYAAINVYHPIEVTKVEPSASDASLVRVHARMASEAGEAISFFQVDKYRIGGKVTDADGKPLEGAVVWIDRDGGEGFAKSTPTDREGKYEMFYWPEEEETNLTVTVGTRRYTLPKDKVYVLPRHTSVEIDIRLPREGTVIEDKPPALVSKTSKGVKYSGVLAGLSVPEVVSYSVTIPDRGGRFILTVPKDVWALRPRFFETRTTKFVEREKILKAGDSLPPGFVQPGANDPKSIVPKLNEAAT